MAHYILVHGAWEGPWSWDYVTPKLERDGHKVTTVNLHGGDGNVENFTNFTMQRYVETVVDAINLLDRKVILVGHSMAGAVISQVAELIPNKIERLVYVAGFLLKSGDSVMAAMQRDPGGEFLPELIFADDESSAIASEQTWRTKAFHDVREKRILEALPFLVGTSQAAEPLMAALSLTEEKFGSVPKVYIRTTLDKMVSPALQDEMVQNWKVDQVSVLQSGHFPILSVPEALAELLE